MEQVIIYLEKKDEMKFDMLNVKQRTLFDLGQAILNSDMDSIRMRVKDAFDVGVTRDDILTLLSWIIKNESSLQGIINVLKSLDFEGSERSDYIDVINDCKED